MTNVKETIANTTDVEYLTELDRYIDKDIDNTNKDVNKIAMCYDKCTEKEYQIRKNKNLKYFANLKKQIREKLKELGVTLKKKIHAFFSSLKK